MAKVPLAALVEPVEACCHLHAVAAGRCKRAGEHRPGLTSSCLMRKNSRGGGDQLQGWR